MQSTRLGAKPKVAATHIYILACEVMDDTKPYHKLGRQIIDAYRDKDCDALLLAVCGWTMKSLVEKI